MHVLCMQIYVFNYVRPQTKICNTTVLPIILIVSGMGLMRTQNQIFEEKNHLSKVVCGMSFSHPSNEGFF